MSSFLSPARFRTRSRFREWDGSTWIVTIGDVADVRLRIIKRTSLFIVQFALSIAAQDSTIAPN